MNNRCTKNDVRKHALKPLTQAFYQAIAIQPDLPKAAGGLLLIGCMGFHHTASAINVSELNGSNGFAVTGAGIGSVQSIGDVNADGNADFITGNAIVFGRSDGSFPASLNTNQLNGSNGFKVDGGYRASADINGDGLVDLAFRAVYPLRDAFVVFGRDTAVDGPFPATIAGSDLDGSNGFRINPPANSKGFISLSAPGDISGDGIDDLALFSIGYSDSQYQYQTYIHVVFGEDAPNAFPADFPLGSINGTNGFRMAINLEYSQRISLIAEKIDFNGDSINDISVLDVYAPVPDGGDYKTEVILASELGSNGVFPPKTNITYSGVKINAGRLVTSYYASAIPSIVGDVDNDGTDDVVLCCDSYNGYANISFGAVQVSPFKPGEKNITISKEYTDKSLNIGGAYPIGDVNDDGVDDLLLTGGDVTRSYNTDPSLRHYVLFGRDVASEGDFPVNIQALYFNGQNGFSLLDDEGVLFGRDRDNHSGASRSAPGDINGDGINDLVIATARHDSPGIDAGRTHIVFGRNTPFLQEISTSNLSPQQGFTIDGVSAKHNVGATVAVSDINNDGFDDVILGSEIDTYVVFGPGTQSSDPIASCPGDVDADGKPDLAVLSQSNGQLSAVIKDINGNQVSSVDFTHTTVAIDMEVMDDINGNGSPELIVLGENPASGEIRDSLTGQLLNSTRLHANGGVVDLATVVDQNGNGTEELVSLNNKGRVTVKDSLNSQTLQTLHFPTDFYTPVDLSVFNSLPPKVGALANHNDPKKRDKVAIKDMSSGRQLMNLWYGRGWDVLQLELLADINGNGAQEAAVLREKTNKFNVMIRDSQSGASLGILGYDSNYSPIRFRVVDDLNNNGSDEIVVLDEHKQNGAIKASVKDSKNKKLIKKMFFNKNLIPHDLAVCPDINGNNQPEVVVLGERENNGELVLVVKDAKTGQLIGKVNY